MSYQSSQANKNWGGAGGGGGVYNYSTGASPRAGVNAVGNWNTGGSFAGRGNQNAVFGPQGPIGGSMSNAAVSGQGGLPWAVQQMLAQNSAEVMRRNAYPGTAGPTDRYIQQNSIPGIPSPQMPMGFGGALPAALSGFPQNPFRRYQTPQPDVLPRQYGPRAWDNEGQYGGNNPAMGFNLANFNNGVWGGAQQTNIPKNSNGGGYTNINKNGGAGGMQFSYGGPR